MKGGALNWEAQYLIPTQTAILSLSDMQAKNAINVLGDPLNLSSSASIALL